MTVEQIINTPEYASKTFFFCNKKGERIFDLDRSYADWELISTEHNEFNVWVRIVPPKKAAEEFWRDLKGTVKANKLPYLLEIEKIADAMNLTVEKATAWMWAMPTQREFPLGCEEPLWVVE